MAIVIARLVMPFLMLFAVSWFGRALLRGYLRRRNEPPQPPGTSSARVVEGDYKIKDERES